MAPRWPQAGPRWPLIRALRELYHVITQPHSKRYLDTVARLAGKLAPPPPCCLSSGGYPSPGVLEITDFGAFLGVLGLFWGCLGSVLCCLALPLGYIWLSWAFLKTPWAFLWLSWTSLGLSWAILSHLGSLSGPRWPKMAPESGLNMTTRRPKMNQDEARWSQDGS